MLTIFDAPDSNVACTRRESSNTPLQALTLWNDPVFMECAQAMAQRVIKESPDETIEQRIRYAFTLSLSRAPTREESQDIRELYALSLKAYQDDTELVDDIAGKTSQPGSVSAAEFAAWIAVARTLINLDEFITRG